MNSTAWATGCWAASTWVDGSWVQTPAVVPATGGRGAGGRGSRAGARGRRLVRIPIVLLGIFLGSHV